MKKFKYVVLILLIISFIGCEKKNEVETIEKDKSNVTNSELSKGNDIKTTAEPNITESKETPAPSVTEKEVIPSNNTASQDNSKTASVDYSSSKLYNYMSNTSNGKSVFERALKLHDGDPHNACVYFVSEALRRVGCDIPVSTANTSSLLKELKTRGFKTNYILNELKPGDICFTTDEGGKIGGTPTHSYIFMSWKSDGIANICDNQVYDYDSIYHPRSIKLSYINNQKDKPKEATAFFMRK